MENFKYNMHDFFEQPNDQAKLTAALQYYFKFGREVYDGYEPYKLEKKGLIDRGEWGVIMNTVLTTSQREILIEKLRQHNNEFEITNRNMPFMSRKMEGKKPKVNDYRGTL